jgi:hypothetical protein
MCVCVCHTYFIFSVLLRTYVYMKRLNTQQHKRMQDLCQSMPCTADHVQSQSKVKSRNKSQSVSQSLYGALCNQKNEVAYTDVSQWAEWWSVVLCNQKWPWGYRRGRGERCEFVSVCSFNVVGVSDYFDVPWWCKFYCYLGLQFRHYRENCRIIQHLHRTQRNDGHTRSEVWLNLISSTPS